MVVLVTQIVRSIGLTPTELWGPPFVYTTVTFQLPYMILPNPITVHHLIMLQLFYSARHKLLNTEFNSVLF